ncbi:MAG: fusA [Acidimicrobiales bacterium]|nr:fusA [Acidimicrobiales bacterium]
MQSVASKMIRNVALVGHNGAGKTSLAEGLLHLAGATPRLGRVEDGTTVSDTEPEEQRRGMSRSLAVLPFTWKGHKINLIDTPGYADFVAEVQAALRIADLAVFVVSAVEGVEAQTEAAWRLAAEAGVPRMVFVNKLDRERADFERTLDQIRDRFGAGIAPLELPIGTESSFEGVADLLTDTAWRYADGAGTQGEVPDDMEALEHRVREAVVEGIVVGDDALLERYLGGDVPSAETLERTLALGIDDATVFPVVCGSATERIALDRLADYLCEIGPSPLDRPPTRATAGDTTVDVAPDPTGPPVALVFKTLIDQFVGHLSLFKVLSGAVHPDDHLVNSRTGDDQRLHALLTIRGQHQEPAEELVTGDIGAVAKLLSTQTGDTLAPKGSPIVVEPLPVPEALYGTGIRARSPSDDDKLATALHQLVEEDPALRIERVTETRQTVLYGTGESHVAITLERLARRHGAEVDTEPVRIAFRQTITAPVDVRVRHKKQTGGHGQFAECAISVVPLERGAGFDFTDRIVGGAISKPYIPAVLKGIEDAVAGGPGRFPIVDIGVTLVDGKEHSVDSSEMAFREAGRQAIREVMGKAAPVTLEPISRLIVIVPSALQGDVLGDINARRGRVLGTEPVGVDEHAVTALVPDVELRRYPVDLRSLTGGRGRYTRQPDRYDIAPPGLAEAQASAASSSRWSPGS